MNSENKDKKKIAALKMCISGAFLSGFSADKVLEDALLILKSAQNEPALYETSVETGKNLILACLELGFSYMEHMELFDFFMEKAGYTPSMLNSLRRKNKPVYKPCKPYGRPPFATEKAHETARQKDGARNNQRAPPSGSSLVC